MDKNYNSEMTPALHSTQLDCNPASATIKLAQRGSIDMCPLTSSKSCEDPKLYAQINGLPSPNNISIDGYDATKVCDFSSERDMSALRYFSNNGSDDFDLPNDNGLLDSDPVNTAINASACCRCIKQRNNDHNTNTNGAVNSEVRSMKENKLARSFHQDNRKTNNDMANRHDSKELTDVVSLGVSQISSYKTKHCDESSKSFHRQQSALNNLKECYLKVSQSSNNNNAHPVQLVKYNDHTVNGQVKHNVESCFPELISSICKQAILEKDYSVLRRAADETLNIIPGDSSSLLNEQNHSSEPKNSCAAKSSHSTSPCHQVSTERTPVTSADVLNKPTSSSSSVEKSSSSDTRTIAELMNDILDKLDSLIPTQVSSSLPIPSSTLNDIAASNDTEESCDDVFRDTSDHLKDLLTTVPSSLPSVSSELPSSATTSVSNSVSTSINNRDTKVQSRNSSSECEKQSPTLEVKTDLELSAIMGLAHGLITGSHMDNLSSKLTNTLHDLAASLSRSKACESSSTTAVSHNQQPQPSKEPTILDSPSMSFEEMVILQRRQWDDVINRDQKNQHKAALLQHRINKLRTKGVSCFSQEELTNLAKKRRNVLSSEDKNTAWAGVFRRNDSSYKHVTDSLTLEKEPSMSSRAPSPASLDKRQLRRTKFLRKLRKNTGVLRKEVKLCEALCDPDLTEESSSDEDILPTSKNSSPSEDITGSVTENTKDEVPHSSISKSPGKTKAHWMWGHEKLSIGRRWTWLQAQYSELEYKIRQHNDLYHKLRASKIPVSLQKQVVSSKCDEQMDVPHVTIAHDKVEKSSRHDTSSAADDAKALVSNITRQTNNLMSSFPRTIFDSPPKPDSPCSLSDTPPDTCSAARTRPLSYPIHRRQHVRASDISSLVKNHPRQVTVANDSHMMKNLQRQVPHQRQDGRFYDISHLQSQSKSAMHDHSYHKILSTNADLPLSLRISNYLASNPNWYKGVQTSKQPFSRSSRNHKKETVSKTRSDEHHRFSERIRRDRPNSATINLEKADRLLKSTLHRHSSDDRSERKRRGSQHSTHSEGKRNRIQSVDSDIEGSPRPFDPANPNTPKMQEFLKRKRAADQAYDINNIVIPHGLTTARIEKLQCKEIITPGWRVVGDLSKQQSSSPSSQDTTEDESIHQTLVSYQTRHDRYEIMEKKKYMAYVEYTLNKKNGTRVASRANLPHSHHLDQSSFLFPSSLHSSPATSRVTSPDITSSPAASPDAFFANYGRQPQRVTSPDLPPPPRSPVPFETSTRSKSLDQQQPTTGASLEEDPQPASTTCMGFDKRVFPLNENDLKELTRSSDEAASALERENLRSSMSSRFQRYDSNTAPKYDSNKQSISGSTTPTPFIRQRTLSHISISEDRFSDSSTSSQKRVATQRTTSGSSSTPRRSLSSTASQPGTNSGRRRKTTSSSQKVSDVYAYSDNWNSDEDETEEEEDYDSSDSTSNDDTTTTTTNHRHHRRRGRRRKEYTVHRVYKTEKRRLSKRRRSSHSESRDHNNAAKKPLVLKIKKS